VGEPGAPNDGPIAGPRRETRYRLVLGPAILAAVVGILWLQEVVGHAWPLDLLMIAFAAGGAAEMARLLRAPGRPLDVAEAVAGAAALAAVGLIAPDDPAVRGAFRGILVALVLVALLVHRLRDRRPEAILEIALTLVPVLSVGLLLSFLRDTADGADGARRVTWIVLVAKASDIGGWLVGKPFGRHKMIPSISPGKSWEGLVGGLALSVAVAVLIPGPLGLAEGSWPALRRTLFGLVVGGASVLAGVTQSAWKRRAGVKDSSPLIPGMGGVLDMLDSLLLAGPAAAAWYALDL
jgi:phosphatidate cytidylyltransferase